MKGMGAAKWEQMYTFNLQVAANVMPLSLAHMEFKKAPEIVSGLH